MPKTNISFKHVLSLALALIALSACPAPEPAPKQEVTSEEASAAPASGVMGK